MKRVATVAAGVLVALGLLATPARAAYSDCFVGYVCVWDGLNASGTLLFAASTTPGHCVNVPTSANDRAESFYNHLTNTGKGAQFYRDANCTGHGLHDTTGYGGPTQPFLAGYMGNFILLDNPQQFGCQNHCDRNIATAIWFNN